MNTIMLLALSKFRSSRAVPDAIMIIETPTGMKQNIDKEHTVNLNNGLSFALCLVLIRLLSRCPNAAMTGSLWLMKSAEPNTLLVTAAHVMNM